MEHSLGGGESVAQAPIEIQKVDKELYASVLEALAREGITFTVPIESLSIDNLSKSRATRDFFTYVNPSRATRASPLRMEVAIDPHHIRIENSNNLSTDAQIEMIKDQERLLKGKLSEKVGNAIRMYMVSVSVIAQLETAYRKVTGKLLLPDYFARTDDQTVPGSVVHIGRSGPSFGLYVDDWGRDSPSPHIFALSVIELPLRK